MRPNDTQTVLSSAVCAGPEARELVWQFIQSKWEVLKQRYPGQNNLMLIIKVSVLVKSVIEE